MTTLTELHVTILETLASAIEAKEELMDVSKGPKEKHSNYMVSAIVLGSDLTDEEFSECRVYLKANAIPVGTINQIARFMAPNEGNEKLVELSSRYSYRIVRGSAKSLHYRFRRSGEQATSETTSWHVFGEGF